MASTVHHFARAALAICALMLAACTSASPSTGPAPAEEISSLEARAWTAESPAGEIAAWVRQGCRRAREGRDVCVERTLVALLDQVGVSRSMEVLDTLATTAEFQPLAHPLAHGLGISAYRSPQTVAATFAACPTSQMSGCHHGVVQGYFLDLSRRGQAIGTAELDALCKPHEPQPFLFFQCGHGMGHGLMAVHGNHLPMALQACDLASALFIRESCYGGAFMENVVLFTHPHHTADGHAQVQGAGDDGHGSGGHDAHGGHSAGGGGHDAHGGHGGGAAMDHGEWKALDRDDPLYPCTVVEGKYLDACYAMQTSAVLFFNHGNVEATARVCGTAPEANRVRCFMSLGRDITAWVGQDHARTIDRCRAVRAEAGGQTGVWCARGAVETLMNQSASVQDGIRFCRALADEESKRDCYDAVGRFMPTVVLERAAREEQCRAAEPAFVNHCRRGAGLSMQQES